MKNQLIRSFSLILAFTALFLQACRKPDTTPPVITLTGGPVSLYIGQIYVEQGATAEDNQDGNLTSNIVIGSPPNTNLSGTYLVHYSVKDAAGNEGTADRTVIVGNQAASLAGSYTVTDSVKTGPNAGMVTIYADSITLSTSVNNRILVRQFGSYINGAVYMDLINNMTSLTIPAQTLTCGSPATVRTFISLTTPTPPTIGGTPTTISFYFQENSNSNTFNTHETYVKN